ncbi:hypothetical protein Afil01_23230 [Actinorhabdospora filicis]|uniref:NB-ARC domain-containing protein n=1 Tax=Actinorhabdospora filicis TaxID=1785913 RepID=A0A9W6SMX2_9ACTN|nr:tetratricopeptide repeat protein [Actinorhabdospora filicis]GLZ77516.1 hypothetical protein Afil01_23230 [Actinorhabdospora filicis]
MSDPSTVHSRLGLATALRELKERAGLSFSALTQATGLKRATLAEAANPRGEHVPSWPTVRALVTACAPEADTEAWYRAWRRAARPGPARVPRQLPPPDPAFTGRARALSELDGLLRRRRIVVVSALIGGGGVGKTALALRWADTIAARFPDGQLYVDLQGFDTGEPLAPATVLGEFLLAFGEPEGAIPETLAGRQDRFRDLLADRRVLVLLDNAAGVEQVRALLPESDTCLVLVTSRDSLTGLIARDGAHRLDVEPMDEGEALDLLRRLLGAERTSDVDSARRIVDRCARLPLALRLAAGHAAERPGRSLAEIADELDPLETGVRPVFSWSYRHLPAGAARLFRLMGAHPGRHLDIAGLTALLGGPAEEHAGVLLAAHLLEEAGSAGFGMHDLLRVYAAELAAADAEREPALTRLFDHFAHTAAHAKDCFAPWDKPRSRAMPGDDRYAIVFTEPHAATAWTDRNLGELTAVAVHAAREGWPGHAMSLSSLLWRHFYQRCRWEDGLAVHSAAAEAAHRLDDTSGEGAAIFRVGDVHWRRGELDPARSFFERSLELKRDAGDRTGQAHALGALGFVALLAGRPREAVPLYLEALDLAIELGNEDTRGVNLLNLGEAHLLLGEYVPAHGRLQEAMTLYKATGHRDTGAWAHLTLSQLWGRLGETDRAARHARESRALAEGLGDKLLSARVTAQVGTLMVATGEAAKAVDHLRRALEEQRRIGDRAGEALTRRSLAAAHRRLGRGGEALAQALRSLEVLERTGNRGEEPESHNAIGLALSALGRDEEAVEHHRAALSGAEAAGLPAAQVVAARRLAVLSPSDVAECRARVEELASAAREARAVLL